MHPETLLNTIHPFYAIIMAYKTSLSKVILALIYTLILDGIYTAYQFTIIRTETTFHRPIDFKKIYQNYTRSFIIYCELYLGMALFNISVTKYMIDFNYVGEYFTCLWILESIRDVFTARYTNNMLFTIPLFYRSIMSYFAKSPLIFIFVAIDIILMRLISSI